MTFGAKDIKRKCQRQKENHGSISLLRFFLHLSVLGKKTSFISEMTLWWKWAEISSLTLSERWETTVGELMPFFQWHQCNYWIGSSWIKEEGPVFRATFPNRWSGYPQPGIYNNLTIVLKIILKSNLVHNLIHVLFCTVHPCKYSTHVSLFSSAPSVWYLLPRYPRR